MANTYTTVQYPVPRWIDASNGHTPPLNPVAGGHDINGETIFIGRCLYQNDVIPGKIVKSHRVCYISYASRELPQSHYQVLCNPQWADLEWESSGGGIIPSGAIQGGTQSDQTKLYIGRTTFKNSMVVGKVHPVHQCLYIPFGGRELTIKSGYEILVLKTLKF